MRPRPLISSLSGIALLLCFAAAIDLKSSEAESKVNPVRIGAIYNLSGSQASLGQPSLNGSILAVAPTGASVLSRGR